jgi:phosphate-selective porin OprO/OprP
LQLAARYSELDVDNDTFKIIDPSKSATQARAWTVGANWYLNSNAIIRADYENVSFSGGAGSIARVTDRPNEQVFATRFQLSF